jgi:hypothetical protein
MQHKGKNRHGGDVAVSAATRLMNDQPAITAITQKPQGSIRAEFVGSNKCVALGLLAKGYSPGLELCRRLVVGGCLDPRNDGAVACGGEGSAWGSTAER